MAKQNNKSEISKSDEVRAILAKNPRAKNKEIRDELANRGIAVSANLVYFVTNRAKDKKRLAKRHRAEEASRQSGTANPVELILEVRRLAAKSGGIRKLKLLVDLLAE